MDWWNNFIDWVSSPEAQPVIFGAAVLVVAIIVSALLASSLTKSAVKRLIAQRDREQRGAAIATLIDAATEASVWNSLTPGEQVMADRAVGQADIQVRLLPLKGSAIAADWAAHQLAEMKRNSATFGYELEPVVAEFRDRLVDWQARPARAKKIFQADLERWQFAGETKEAALVAEQDKWVAEQHHDAHATPDEKIDTSTRFGETVSDADAQTQKLIDDVAALDQRKAKTQDAGSDEKKSA